MSISAMVWNARGWRTKALEFLSKSNAYDLCFITETKSKRNNQIRVPGFDVYERVNYRQGEGGAEGVAILICRHIKREPLDMSRIKGNFDVVGIRIESTIVVINFVCTYRRRKTKVCGKKYSSQ